MEETIWLITGLLIGGTLGGLATALAVAAGHSSSEAQRVRRRPVRVRRLAPSARA